APAPAAPAPAATTRGRTLATVNARAVARVNTQGIASGSRWVWPTPIVAIPAAAGPGSPTTRVGPTIAAAASAYRRSRHTRSTGSASAASRNGRRPWTMSAAVDATAWPLTIT